MCSNQGTSFAKIVAGKQAGEGSFDKEQVKAALEGLLDAYGYMMLERGVFHADPHGGKLSDVQQQRILA